MLKIRTLEAARYAAGGISTRATPGGELTQRLLLEKEGIRLDGKGADPVARLEDRTESGVKRTISV